MSTVASVSHGKGAKKKTVTFKGTLNEAQWAALKEKFKQLGKNCGCKMGTARKSPRKSKRSSKTKRPR